MNQSVSRTNHNGKVFRLISFVPGLFQGGELVTMRAAEMVEGTLYHPYGPIPQHAIRDVG